MTVLIQCNNTVHMYEDLCFLPYILYIMYFWFELLNTSNVAFYEFLLSSSKCFFFNQYLFKIFLFIVQSLLPIQINIPQCISFIYFENVRS